ncbi:MFS transporter [Francisella sp. SYW-9]|uniref:MFS transporter n=1 Tax=Francisella sp. SYW-9 TaxID=2610888 RepID=UPI00123DEA43|nr:MFS transporter [Francisella sp. SYW-9]
MSVFKKSFLWAITEVFFILSIFVAVLFGIYGSDIQYNNHLSATELSIISGTFFIVFSLSQLFAGILIDKTSPRLFLGGSAIVSALGCVIFANTSAFEVLLLSRVLLGLGLGCAFLSVIYTIQSSFPEERFVLFVSISLCVANILVGTMGMVSGSFLSGHSYNFSFTILAILLFIVGILLMALFDKNVSKQQVTKSKQGEKSLFQMLKEIFTKRSFWFSVLFFIGLLSGILTFSDLFNVSYQMDTFGISHENAISLNGMIPIGMAVGAPLAGWLSSRYSNQLVAIGFSFIALLSIILILYVPFSEYYRLEISYIVNFIFGVGCGSTILAYEEIRLTVSSLSSRMLANSLILTIAHLFNGLILQPLIGFIVDHTTVAEDRFYVLFSANYMRWLYDDSINNLWHRYDGGLSLITFVLVISFISSIFFKSKKFS